MGLRGPKPIPVMDRIARMTEYDPETGCLNFTGATNKGYGWIGSGGKGAPSVEVHLIAWRILVGPVPEGKRLDHFRCNNPRCWNITHTRPVTPRENNLRGNGAAAMNAAKKTCPCGEPYDAKDSLGRRFHRECYNRKQRERRAARD